jgi:4-hydroxy-tetrahydrodipicolinate reductase
MAIRVVVSGSGNMGLHVMQAVQAADDMELAGVLEKFSSGEQYAPPDGGPVLLRQDAADVGDFSADVLVDFSNAAWSEQVVPAAIAVGVRPVVGTSGLSPAFVAECAAQCASAHVGGVVASNFALGAVMMMHLSRVAAPFFDAVEVIEQHHDGKVDAPSGTAMTTAREMRAARDSDFDRNVAERETLPDARGSELGGVTLHSVRLPGLVAHQTVLFGGVGETLTIRHDSTSRESFMPGVLRAVRSVMEQDGLVEGLDRILGLRE